MAPKPAIDPRLRGLASSFTAEWLAGQRWYRAKSRRLTSVELSDAAAIPGTTGWLLVLVATDDEGAVARYLVPAVLGLHALREPADGEGVWGALAELMASGGKAPAAIGRFDFNAAPGLREIVSGAHDEIRRMTERRLGVEQSNTSVVLGDRLILKCYRLLEAGVNPEVEVNAFLTEVGFRGAPRLCGSAEYVVEGEACAAVMLQELVVAEADGWGWVQGCLAAGPSGMATATDGLGEVGALTREMHRSLASRPESPGFPSRSATGDELATWQGRAEGQLEVAIATVSGEIRRRLTAMAPTIRRRVAAIGAVRGAHVSRIHGDYHLGQLLRTVDGFTVIDFEGEPARALAERREPASPLRDVAGMLRSIDYAARVAHQERGWEDPDTWAGDARVAFLSSYDDRLSADDLALLDAFETERACYEVAYEANNRPDWAWVPLMALERMAGSADLGARRQS